MGWNGSDIGGAVNKPKASRGAKRSSGLIRICLWAVIGLVIVGATFVFYSRSEKPVVVERKQTVNKIAATEKVAVKRVATTNVVEKKLSPNEETYRDAKGILRYKIGNGRVRDPSRPSRKINPMRDKDGNLRHKSRFAIFGNRVDNEIAGLISMVPGATMFGMRRYDEKFEAEFRESLKEKIEILPTDSPREKLLKQNMIEVKQEIADRMQKGEKLANILGEARTELQKLATYRRSVQKMVQEHIENEKFTTQDVKDLVKAANMMLKDKGVAPLQESSFVRAHLGMQSESTAEQPDSNDNN